MDSANCWNFPACGHDAWMSCSTQEGFEEYPVQMHFDCELCGAPAYQPCDRWCWSEVDDYEDRFVLMSEQSNAL